MRRALVLETFSYSLPVLLTFLITLSEWYASPFILFLKDDSSLFCVDSLSEKRMYEHININKCTYPHC